MIVNTFTATGTRSHFSTGNLSQIPFFPCSVQHQLETRCSINCSNIFISEETLRLVARALFYNHKHLRNRTSEKWKCNGSTFIFQWERDARSTDANILGLDGSVWGLMSTPPYSSSEASSILTSLRYSPVPFIWQEKVSTTRFSLLIELAAS